MIVKFAQKIERKIKRYNAKRALLKRQNQKLRKFKDCHKGKDCVIMGSGPSLKEIPHEFLEKFVVFGVSMSFRYYFPDYWVVNDAQLSWMEEGRKLCHEKNVPAFISWVWAKEPEISYENEVIFYPYRMPIEQSSKNLQLKNHLKNLFDNPQYIEKTGMSGVNNVVTEGAIPLALYMGCKRIFLAGVDYSVPKTGGSHFMKDTEGDQKIIDQLTKDLQDQYNSKHDRFFHKRWGIEMITESKNGHKIFNLSEISSIQKIPKVNYKDILDEITD